MKDAKQVVAGGPARSLFVILGCAVRPATYSGATWHAHCKPSTLAKQVEKTLLERITDSRKGELSRGHVRMRELRGADAAISRLKARKA